MSAVVHSALIASAVVATMPPPVEYLDGRGEIARPRVEHIQFVQAPASDASEGQKSPAPVEVTTRERLAVVLAFNPEAVTPVTAAEISSVMVPDANLEAETADWVERQFTGLSTRSLITDAIRRVYAAAVDGAYDQDVVEKTVWPRENNPRPAYPSALLSAGVEAHVLARFVVDSSGRVNENSVIFPENAHRLFVDAIKRALKRSRYFPAELAGRRVAQRVMQEFVFRIER